MDADEKKPRGVRNPILDFLITLAESGALRTMPGSALKVLTVLLTHRNSKFGTAWPSTKTIQEKAGIGRSQIFRSIRWLIAAGIIERKRGPASINFVNVYSVNLNPQITIPPTPVRRKKKLSGGCHNKTREGISQNTQKIRGGVTSDTAPLGIQNETHLLGVISEPQSIEVKGSSKKEEHPYTISKKTAEEWKKLKGAAWLYEQIKKGGYVIEDEDPVPLEEGNIQP